MHNSVLPKLLAKENITIRHGNYQTAWFDIEKRVLGLPSWKDMSKDVYDLLIGHEVGHALDTPFEGWHDSPEKLEGCPRSYINVIEDARIERKQLDRYPGLVAPFSRGYRELLESGFFSDLDDIDWDKVKLIDKINLKTKLRNLIEVPFTPEEVGFYNRSLKTETFEEVVNLVREIYEFTKENTPELLSNPTPPDQSLEENLENAEDTEMDLGHDDQIQGEEDTKESGDTNGDSEDSEEDSETDSGSKTQENTEQTPLDSNEEDEEEGKYSARPEDLEQSITDNIFREMERNLLETDQFGGQSRVMSMPSKNFIDHALVSYEKLTESRNKTKEYSDFEDSLWVPKFREYLKGVKKSVNFAVKEFEMRKSAYRYQRASISKTGRIDVNKLWSYKTNEDIFKQVTTLADSKNHGMIMLLDLSGSMSGSMRYVSDQLIHLIMFCKAVNIPFDVYGFTSTNDDLGSYEGVIDGDIDLSELSLVHLSSSQFKKQQFDDSVFNLYLRVEEDLSSYYHSHSYLGKYESYGSTPLDEALVICHKLIPEFKTKNQVQKMNLVTFTDGQANQIRSYSSRKLQENKIDSSWGDVKIMINGKSIKSDRYSLTKSLLENIQKRFDTKTLGFFMADNARDFRGSIWRADRDKKKISNQYYEDRDLILNANKEYSKNKCVTMDKVLGYDHYYILKGGKNLDTDPGEFVVEDTSRNKLSTAFKKYSKNKKVNKVLLTTFGRHVA